MHGIQEFDGHSLISPEAIAMYARDIEGEAGENTSLGSVLADLDELKARFEEGQSGGLLAAEAVALMHRVKKSMRPADWRASTSVIAEHPVSAFLLQDPFTNWSHRKPRGYSGDAGLLDFVYGHPSVKEEVDATTDLGRAIYETTRNAPSCAAVRERLQILARYVDAAAETAEGAEILAVAAGHLRESSLSHAAREGLLKRWVALDQDPRSIAEIGSCGIDCVQPTPGSVRDVIARAQRYGTFDLVYSAGLYDYLDHKVAVKMTQKCLQMLKPGGTYLFANFADDMPDDGYMESFMRWELILRSREDMQRVIEDSTASEHKSDIFFGENRTVIYAAITRTQ
jgi:SAM-dependent methyltransferase